MLRCDLNLGESPMYSLTVRETIMIAHSFRGAVFGPAQRLHGATFVVEATLSRAALDDDGLIADIGRFKNALQTVLAPFNYRNLDEIPDLAGINTTTEWLAGATHQRLSAAIQAGALENAGPFAGLAITVRESPDAWASFAGPLA